MLFYVDILGYIGTCILGFTLLPQVIKTYSEKNAQQISTLYLMLQMVANIIFIIYAYYINSIPIIICNGIVLLFSSSLLFAKQLYKNNEYSII